MTRQVDVHFIVVLRPILKTITSSTAPTSTAHASSSPKSAPGTASRCSTPTRSSWTGRRCGPTFCSMELRANRARTAQHSGSPTSTAGSRTAAAPNGSPHTNRPDATPKNECSSRTSSPTPRSIAPRFHGNALNPAFASNLEPLIAWYQPALWIHGHMHNSVDVTGGATRVLAKPWGIRRGGEPRIRPRAVRRGRDEGGQRRVPTTFV